MASIILAAAGTAIGGSIGGAVLGVSAATIGGAIGSLAGAAIDSWLVASMAPMQRIAGQRLDTLQITASTEGAVIPRVHGRMRLGGNIIWATDFREETRTTEQGGGKGGGGGGTEVTEYFYFASLAVALCEGPITGIGRIWADGKPMSLEGVTMRVHLGRENQAADPFIAAKMGAANTPAYRGTAYVFFEELPLERFGSRPTPGGGASPARRPRAMPAAPTRPQRRTRRSPPSSARRSPPTSTLTTSRSTGTATRTTGACGG